MRQVYFCPQCRASIGVGDRFCSNCGTHLNWVILQTPPRPSRESYSSPCPDRQQEQQRQLPSGNKQPVFHQQQKMSKEMSVIPQRNGPSTDGTVTPISAEISRLLSDFFTKQVQNNWPDSIDSAYFFVGRFQYLFCHVSSADSSSRLQPLLFWIIRLSRYLRAGCVMLYSILDIWALRKTLKNRDHWRDESRQCALNWTSALLPAYLANDPRKCVHICRCRVEPATRTSRSRRSSTAWTSASPRVR